MNFARPITKLKFFFAQNQFRLDDNFANSLNISKYNQIKVTINPNAPYHSMYLGAPFSAPSSIKSKSSTKLSAAIITTTMLKPMLRGEALSICIIPMEEPKNPIIKFTKYTKAIPPVAEKYPVYNFQLVLYFLMCKLLFGQVEFLLSKKLLL